MRTKRFRDEALFSLFISPLVVSNSCNLSFFRLALEFPSHKNRPVVSLSASRLKCMMWTDWICIVWPSVSYSFSSVIFWGSSVFCPNLAPHQSIHHHLSLCPLVFHLSLAFYPSVHLPPHPSTKSSDPWLLPTAHSGMSQWTPVFGEVSEWSVITRTRRHDPFDQFI